MRPDEVVTDPEALTPIQRRKGPGIWLKRDDLFEVAGVRGAKARVVWSLAQGAAGLVTAGSRSSPQVNAVAQIAAELGIGCRAHIPTGTLSPELELAEAAGAKLIRHKAGRNTVLAARCREDAGRRGWVEIPLGLELEEAVASTARQLVVPKQVQRIVVCVGYGMTLAGVARRMAELPRGQQRPILGVIVGADPGRRLERYAPEGWQKLVQLVEAAEGYDEPAPVTEPDLWRVRLDPHYEAKVVPFVSEGDLVWLAGIRQSALLEQATAPPAQAAETQVLRSADELAEVRIADARELEVAPESVRLLVGASVYLGKRRPWTDYQALYERVYLERALPALRQDGYFVLIQTDAYEAGRVIARNRLLPTLLAERGLELIDRKVWQRERADHFQPPFSEVFIYRPPGGTASRKALQAHPEYFRGVWDYPQAAGGPLAAYPPGLCRLLVEAFTDEGDLILDPFAGTARLLGIAAALGRRAIGYEVDPSLVGVIEQNLGLAQAATEGADELALEADSAMPRWCVGDARDVDALVPEGLYDLIFTCPPYYDLERYTDDPADLSAAETYEAFLADYRTILERAARRLRPDRFAVIVVGEIRDEEGRCRGFVSDTIRIAGDVGLRLYNDAVLVTPHGSLPVRAARAFEASRKLGRTHQNILVFVKGDWRKATAELGSVEFGKGEELTPDAFEPPAV